MSSPRRQRGAFTLLELLVATAMTAVLAGSLYATLHVAFRARRSALAAVEETRKVDLAFELVRADVQSAVVPNGILAGGFIGTDTVDATGRDNDALLLYCTADGSVNCEGTGDVRMVEFACEADGEGDGLVLVRRVTVNLLATHTDDPSEEVLCRGLRSFDLKYFDGTDWLDEWDSGVEDNVLPLAMQVTLQQTAGPGRPADETGPTVSRVLRLPCSSITPGQQVEMGSL